MDGEMNNTKNKMNKKLLLLGGWHAHIYILKKLQEHELPNVSVSLLSPSRYQYYSGMFSGYVEGLYSVDDIRVDLEHMAKQSNVNWIEASAQLINSEEQVVQTDQGETIEYDVV